MRKTNRFVFIEFLNVITAAFLSGAVLINLGVDVYDVSIFSSGFQLFSVGPIIAALFAWIILRFMLKKIEIPHFGLIAAFGFLPLLQASGLSNSLSLRFMLVDTFFFWEVIKNAIIQGCIVAIGVGIIYLFFNYKYFKK